MVRTPAPELAQSTQTPTTTQNAFSTGDVLKASGKWGFVTSNGDLAIEPEYDMVRDFAEGRAAVRVDFKWGFIDRDGELVIPAKFRRVHDFSEGLALVSLDGNQIFIDKDGKQFVQPAGMTVLGGFRNGRASVRDGDHFGFIDRTGTAVIPLRFANANHFSDGYAGVRVGGGRWGFVDVHGRLDFAPNYSRVGVFSNGLAAVMLDGKWGFINTNGEVVVPARFEGDAPRFVNGRARVQLNGKYGFIDKSGELIITPRYAMASEFQEGLAWAPESAEGEEPGVFIDTNAMAESPSRCHRSGGFRGICRAAGLRLEERIQ